MRPQIDLSEEVFADAPAAPPLEAEALEGEPVEEPLAEEPHAEEPAAEALADGDVQAAEPERQVSEPAGASEPDEAPEQV